MRKYLIILSLSFYSNIITSQSLRQKTLSAISNLEQKIEDAESNNLVVEKEKMTLRTAKVCLFYSDWDENNIAINKSNFSKIYTYQNNRTDAKGRNLDAIANDLPDIQREAIYEIVNRAITNIDNLKNGTLIRRNVFPVNWKNVFIKNVNGQEQIIETRNGIDHPVLVHDFTFKPEKAITPEGKLSLTEYHGNMADLFVSANRSNENGEITPFFLNTAIPEARNKKTLGRIFLGHTQVPEFLKEKYKNRKDDKTSIYAGQRSFTTYDIDNPDTRKVWKDILGAIVGKLDNSTLSNGLGYLLANEPHFSTSENTFDNGVPRNINQQNTCDIDPFCNKHSVSFFTMQKFVAYLKTVYGNSPQGLFDLNKNWFGVNTTNYYENFEEINGPIANENYGFKIPFSKSLVGSPAAYDWMLFNKNRVTEWFTFLHDEITNIDPDAKTQIKIIPRYFTEDIQSAGLDMEALINLQEIVGNDATITQKTFPFGPQNRNWENRYDFDWHIMALYFDFGSSVKPKSLNFNSEQHYLSSVRHRDIYLTPEYTRASMWLAAMYGENASNIWYWPRKEDGSMRKNDDSFYPGSLTHQPAVINEVGNVMFDLNAFGNEIYSIRNARKPIRIFYSQTSAINKTSHMRDQFDLYEYMNFDGIPLGFATANIIKTQNNTDWDTIIIYKTPFVTDLEFETLQTYLNKGGTIIIDSESLSQNEYGKKRSNLLNTSKGGKILNLSDINEIRLSAINEVNVKSGKSAVSLTENQTLINRGCFWRVTKDTENNTLINIVNLRKGKSTVKIDFNNNSNLLLTNLFNGALIENSFVMKPSEVLLLKIEENQNIKSQKPNTPFALPNPTEKIISIDLINKYKSIDVSFFDMKGKRVADYHKKDLSKFDLNIEQLDAGVYLLNVDGDNQKQILNIKILKK